MGFEYSQLPNLSGRVFLVTGGNTGVGYHTCLELARCGARVYMGARSADKAAAAIDTIRTEVPAADVRHLQLDLASFDSVVAASRQFMSREAQLHVLVNNAGIMGLPFARTVDGEEAHWQTNYLGHWLLTRRLMPILLATAAVSPAGVVRVVNTSSIGHNYAPSEGVKFEDTALESSAKLVRYGQSKLANVLHAKSINSLYGPGSLLAKEGRGQIWAVATHPGAVDTQLNSNFAGKGMGWVYPVLRCAGAYTTPSEGARSNVFAAASDEFPMEWCGKFLGENAELKAESKLASNEKLRIQLENWTEDKMRKGHWLH